jgi:hypothetical protein
MKRLLILISAVSILLVGGCKSTKKVVKAPTSANGKKIQISLICNSGLTHGDLSVTANRRREVNGYMKKNLITTLRARNFVVTVIKDKKEFTYTPGHYLLEVTIDNYSYGYRYRGPYGSGMAANLATSFKITGADVLLSDIHSTNSTRNWKHCCIKLNKDTVDRIIPVLPEFQAIPAPKTNK